MAVKRLQHRHHPGVVALDARDQARGAADVAGGHGVEHIAIGFLHITSLGLVYPSIEVE
jgi:hypothetical protein